MSKTELLIRLRDLHEDLSGINIDLDSKEQIDEDTIDALGQLATDVGGLIDQAKDLVENDSSDEAHQDLLDRVASFDTQHPKVTRFLSQMTDLLGLIGI
ncbi:MAG: hypothetical protein ACI87E_001195 [Mariniblastus sp.]|jgi:hypothetical protein